jgi:hypothetical protein
MVTINKMDEAPQPKGKLPHFDGTQRQGCSNYRCGALAHADALCPTGVLRNWVDQAKDEDGDPIQENLPAQPATNRAADKKLLGGIVQSSSQEPLGLAKEGQQDSKAAVGRPDGNCLSQGTGQRILAVEGPSRKGGGEHPVDRYFNGKRRLFREDPKSPLDPEELLSAAVILGLPSEFDSVTQASRHSCWQ